MMMIDGTYGPNVRWTGGGVRLMAVYEHNIGRAGGRVTMLMPVCFAYNINIF